MDMRRLASYAYHNCEFLHAIRCVQGSPPDEDLAAVHLKALSELDRKQEAVRAADAYAAAHPRSGHLHYLRGMAYYLAGMPKAEIEGAFLAAAELRHPSANMGLAFIEFANKRYASATNLLQQAGGGDDELDHIRRLMLFQVYAADVKLADAEEQLRLADRLLAQSPSLLRQFWGQLCWVRLLRAKGLFEGALAVLERVLGQIDEQTTPRLWRNASEARKMIDARSEAPNIIVPQDRQGRVVAEDPRLRALERITRKPMLHSLFTYLTAAGGKGASKEDIAENVWEESYNPVIHDDRIYKAIGRLRKLLGDDLEAPKYLTQLGRNYILNVPAPTPDPAGEPR